MTPHLAAFVALLSFEWTPDTEEPGRMDCAAILRDFPAFGPMAVTSCEAQSPLWEARVAWDVAEELSRECGGQATFLEERFALVASAAIRATLEPRP